MSKTVYNVPVRKSVSEEVAKVSAAIRSANYSGFFSAFVYANIALYFFWVLHLIWK